MFMVVSEIAAEGSYSSTTCQYYSENYHIKMKSAKMHNIFILLLLLWLILMKMFIAVRFLNVFVDNDVNKRHRKFP